MAVYKVPQDVEAEDKLIAWLSFRQFIYIMIAGGSAVVAFFLFQASPFLIIIPLPFIIIFGILSLPLKKDQPLETYLLAIIRFYLKPKTRLWDPDGTVSYVEITAPKAIEQNLAKDFGAETAQQRLSYLARIMDSRGWAYKGMATNPTSESVVQTVATEAQSAVDVMDESADLSRSFQQLINEKDAARRQAVTTQMQQAATAPPTTTVTASAGPPAADDTNIKAPTYNPYPSSMHQKIIQPLGAQHQMPLKKPPATVPPKVSPDIIRLASNDDLSISALAHEAHRANEDSNEVVVQLH